MPKKKALMKSRRDKIKDEYGIFFLPKMKQELLPNDATDKAPRGAFVVEGKVTISFECWYFQKCGIPAHISGSMRMNAPIIEIFDSRGDKKDAYSLLDCFE
jgi:hypothetical protein